MAQPVPNSPETATAAVVAPAAAVSPVAPTDLSPDEAQLQSIFPELDAATIHDMYVVCDRNLERTIEFLLGDDGHAPTNVTNASGGMSQSDIDEQLARNLEQEELSAAAGNTRAWNPQQPPAPTAPRQPTSLRSSQTQQNPPSEGPNIQEEFQKIAEMGKTTFINIFNKVKEKIKEFEQPPPGSGASTSQQQQPYYAPAPVNAMPAPQSNAAPMPYQASFAPPAGPPTNRDQQQQRVTTAESSAIPTGSSTTTTATAPPAPPIDVSKAAFLAKKPTPLTETSKPHPEENLTENPFDDRA